MGKSTLLRCIYRVLRPHAGLVGVDGDGVWKLTARAAARRTAVVVQEPPSDFDFAVRDMVMMGRAPHRRYSTLSGGERQRVLIASGWSVAVCFGGYPSRRAARHQNRCRAAMPQSSAESGTSVHPEGVILCDRLAAYGVLSCYSVRVLVNVLKVPLMDVRMRVRLSGVAVFMLMLNVLVIVQDVRVGVRYLPMRVLMGVLLHRLPRSEVYSFRMSNFPRPYVNGSGPSSTDTTRRPEVAGKFSGAHN